MLRKLLPITAVLTFALAMPALASDEAELSIDFPDVQAIDATATPGFGGTTHTGSLLFSPTSSTQTVLRDNEAPVALFHPVFFPPGVTSMSGSTQLPPYDSAGELILVGGAVAGGTINVTLGNGDTFSADFVPASGNLAFDTGEYRINGELTNVSFSGPTFGGYDVSAFAGTWGGEFQLTKYTPNGSGLGSSSQLDLELIVPEPASIALFGLGGLLICHHRGRKA